MHLLRPTLRFCHVLQLQLNDINQRVNCEIKGIKKQKGDQSLYACAMRYNCVPLHITGKAVVYNRNAIDQGNMGLHVTEFNTISKTLM